MTDTITVNMEPAPSTPLALQFAVMYAPRVPTPPFVAFRVVEVGPSLYNVEAIDGSGATVRQFTGELGPAWQRLAMHLRMDTETPKADAPKRHPRKSR